MKTKNQVFSVVILAAGVALSGAASADNCGGTWHNVGQSASKHDLGNGVTLTSASALTSSVNAKTGEMAVGTCVSYVLAMPDKKVRVVYACARKNKAGDVAVDEGALEPGAERGTWKITSATGGLAKTIGDSGWWKTEISDGKVSSGTWSGNCK